MNPENKERFANTDRDEATLGVSRNRRDAPQGVGDEDQPIQRPPETQPEPRPAAPVMKNKSSDSSQSTNTNSPA